MAPERPSAINHCQCALWMGIQPEMASIEVNNVISPTVQNTTLEVVSVRVITRRAMALR